MKYVHFVYVFAMAAVVMSAHAIPQQINYQGFLTRPDGSPLDTTVAMTFRIYDDLGGVHFTETHPAVAVENGLFNVRLGSITTLSDVSPAVRRLGVTVGSDVEMTPRQQITSVAHAYHVGTVASASGGSIISDVDVTADLRCDTLRIDNTIRFPNGTFQNSILDTTSLSTRINLKADSTDHATRTWVNSMGYLRGDNNVVSASGFIGGGDYNKARGDYSTIGGGGGGDPADSNSALALWSTVGGGRANQATGDRSVVGGGWSNAASGFVSAISGGVGNIASQDQTTVGGGYFNTAGGDYATVGGGHTNVAGGQFSTIGGGTANEALDYSTVSGGSANVADDFSAIGGGDQNSATNASTIAGGGSNDASGTLSAIGGGVDNTASGGSTTIGGGGFNTASAVYATIPGGFHNEASGNWTFAAGIRARALHNGTFVWGSSSAGDTTQSFNNYTVTFRCENGARFLSHSTNNTGVELPAGGGAWQNLCDKNQKNFHGSVNSSEILDRVSSLPLHRWSYKSQNESIQHIGPTAQDFHAAFGLGDNTTTISTLDPDGVALAAIQELAKENDKLKERVLKLEALVQSLIARGQTGMFRTEDREE